MYRCNSCGERLGESELYFADVSFAVPYGEGYALCPDYELRCGYCGSEEVEEI